MDNSSLQEQQEQHRLIEKYVAGLMSEDEVLEFEAFILSKPDWQAKVDLAGEQFDETHQQQWREEIAQTLEQNKQQKKPAFSWLFNLMPTALAFGLGALMVVVLTPEQVQPTLGKAHRVNLPQTRSAAGRINETIVVIDKGVDNLVLQVPVEDDLSWRYTVSTDVNGEHRIRDGYQPDERGMLTFLLARQFNRDELITVRVSTEANGNVIREYRLLIREK